MQSPLLLGNSRCLAPRMVKPYSAAQLIDFRVNVSASPQRDAALRHYS